MLLMALTISKLRALTPLEDTIGERLKKGRGEQVVFTTVGKPI